MSDYPSGTVAFLFTDIEGSTRLWEADHQAMAVAVERHFAILRDAITAEGGVHFKTIGDAIQAAFPTVPAAVTAAVNAQHALRTADWSALGAIRVRMAIHAGDAIPHNGDYLAHALNRLSRVLSVGYGEQILLTDTARTLATPLPSGYALRDLGRHRLRDLLEADHLYQVTGPGLPAEFAALKSLDLRATNIPTQPTPLIGREQELATLDKALRAPETRLLTLVGPGGSGKTRLAMQAVAETLDAFPDGGWWVPLAAVSDPTLVLQAIAAPLGVRENPGQPLRESLITYLRSRRILLLLDNVEQVVEAAPDIRTLLEQAPGVVILATSREPLRLRAEREFPLPPLPLPPTGGSISLETALASPAVRLFVERAQAVNPSFTITAANVGDIVAICRRLDGLPLAIELAAARVRILPPGALLARLDHRLALLTGGARDLPARQQTLRAAIAWSYDLLQPAERALFARLGIFAGGFMFDAAEAVCAAAGGLSLDLFDGLDSLVQKSLLRQEEILTGDSRFTMLETIREFAREQLCELPDVEELREAHADWFLTLAETADWDDVTGQADLLDRLEADHANLRQAIAFYEARGTDGLSKLVRLVAALAHFWWIRGYFTEGRRALESAIAGRGDIPSQDCSAAISGAALLAEAQGDLERAEQLHHEALAIRRETGDPKGIARSLTGLGAIARQRGDLATARSRHEEALDAWRDVADAPGTAGALLDLGLIRLLEGDYTDAETTLRESLGVFQRLGDIGGEATALHSLGALAVSKGDLPDAIARFSESLRIWRILGNQQMIATDLANLGEAHHLSGSLDTAETLYQEARTLFEDLGDPLGRGYTLCQLGLLALDHGNVSEARTHLLESLQVRWSAGERGAAADTLEALAETSWQLGDLHSAARLLQTTMRLRQETGLARLPVYEARFGRVLQAVGDLIAHLPPLDIDTVVDMTLRPAHLARPLANQALSDR